MFDHHLQRGGKLLALLTIVLLLGACGGGTTAGSPNFSGDPADTPGVIGNFSEKPSILDNLQPFLYQPAGVSADAPLGTDPAYNVQPAAASVGTRLASKTSSELDPGATYGIQGVTLAAVGAAPNYAATNLVFNEGDKVVLWLRFEAAANAQFSRRWVINAAGLDYLEPMVKITSAGVYDASLTFNLPYDIIPDGGSTAQAELQVVIGLPKSAAVVVGPGDLSDRKAFIVNSVVTDSRFIYPLYETHAQMCWEDILQDATGRSPDYDYNDLVAMMWAKEYRNINNELVQIDLQVKALARGAGWTSDWQFNMDAAFPGAMVIATVDQYYATGVPHGSQRVWTSANGASVPVFAPTKDALPKPPDHSFATNVVAGTTYMDGDYADVKIILDKPLPQGAYTPIPYKPELRVSTTVNSQPVTYAIGLWRKPGDPVDKNGRPLGFIIPDTFAWPLETKKIDTVYSGFAEWITWINNQSLPEPSPKWYDRAPVRDYFVRSSFK